MEENALISSCMHTSQQKQYHKVPLCGILNYFLIVGKLCLLSCRRNQTLPNTSGFKANIVLQCKTDKNTSTCTYSKMKIFLKPNRPNYYWFKLRVLVCVTLRFRVRVSLGYLLTMCYVVHKAVGVVEYFFPSDRWIVLSCNNHAASPSIHRSIIVWTEFKDITTQENCRRRLF